MLTGIVQTWRAILARMGITPKRAMIAGLMLLGVSSVVVVGWRASRSGARFTTGLAPAPAGTLHVEYDVTVHELPLPQQYIDWHINDLKLQRMTPEVQQQLRDLKAAPRSSRVIYTGTAEFNGTQQGGWWARVPGGNHDFGALRSECFAAATAKREMRGFAAAFFTSAPPPPAPYCQHLYVSYPGEITQQSLVMPFLCPFAEYLGFGPRGYQQDYQYQQRTRRTPTGSEETFAYAGRSDILLALVYDAQGRLTELRLPYAGGRYTYGDYQKVNGYWLPHEVRSYDAEMFYLVPNPSSRYKSPNHVNFAHYETVYRVKDSSTSMIAPLPMFQYPTLNTHVEDVRYKVDYEYKKRSLPIDAASARIAWKKKQKK